MNKAVMFTFSFHLLTSYQSCILDFGEIRVFFKGNSNIQESEASFAICTVSTLKPVWLPVMILLLKSDVGTSLVMHHSFINPFQGSCSTTGAAEQTDKKKDNCRVKKKNCF